MLFYFALSCTFASALGFGLAPGLYCGLENCYDVLSINRDDFQKSELAKAYRKFAKLYHPDRVADQSLKAEAEEKFRRIATAYETLKDDDTRSDYDYYLDHPEERAYNYYQYYRRRVSPKVDVRIVIVVTVVLISAFQFLSASHKYREALDYAIKQEKYRNGAKEIARERGLLPSEGGRKNKKTQKEDVEQIIRQIIAENMDVRGGYKKPSVYDTLLWTLIASPVTLFRYVIWRCRWILKYWIKKENYDSEAKLYLIRKHMSLSDDQFACFSEAEIAGFVEDELWKKDVYDEWMKVRQEEEKERLATSGRYKRYRRYMKNQAGNTISFVEE